ETEPQIHAFVWLDAARAHRLAAASDERRRSGGAVGPLEGIPVGVKDIFDTAGIPTENGSALFAGRVPNATCPAVSAAEAAGAFEFSRTLDHVGVFARSVRSAGLFAAILAGETERAPHVDDDHVPRFAALRTSEWEQASNDMRERFQADVDALALVGGPVEWPEPPVGLDDAQRILRTVMLYEAGQAVLPKVARRPETGS